MPTTNKTIDEDDYPNTRILDLYSLDYLFGLSDKNITTYEDGSRVPTSFKIYYIAVYYNILLDYLVERTDIKEIK